MSRLYFSTFLKVLKKYMSPQESGQKRIANALFTSICNEPISFSATDVNRMLSGKRGFTRDVNGKLSEIEFVPPYYYDNFISKAFPLLNRQEISNIVKVLSIIVYEDETIKNGDIVDYITGTTKENIWYITDKAKFIAGIFIFTIRCRKNVHTEIYSNEINDEFFEASLIKYDRLAKLKNNQDSKNSDDKSQANAFLQTYEDSIELLPLCQIANIVNPGHNYVNQMYSDYCKCNNDTQKQIMDSIDCSLIEGIGKFELYNLVHRFADDAENADLLSKGKYAISQYFLESLEYDEYKLEDPDPTYFPTIPLRVIPNRTTSNLYSFILNYIDYKNTNQRLPIPFDWMWDTFNYSNRSKCPTEKIVYGINLFIISSCQLINSMSLNDMQRKNWVNIPNVNYVKTIEDLHLLALLVLYDVYMS